MMKHYHVLQGMNGGYMPDESIYCKTLKDAKNVAVELAKEWRDDFTEYEEGVWGPCYKVTGSLKRGWYDIEVRPYSSTHLGWYIEIVECEEDCEEENYE
jgi:hypothetical protein